MSKNIEIFQKNLPHSIHPRGFAVFLSSDEVEKFNEYSNGDPHGVAKGIHNEFQKRRIECTLELLQIAMENKGNDLTVLDIGCGEGHITNEIKKLMPKAKIYGLDYSLSAIETAATNFSAIEFCVANAYQPPYPDETFDIVVCNNVWEHIPDPLFLLSRIYKITKPCGYLVLSTPSRYRLNNIMKELMGKSPSLMAVNHVTEYSVNQVIEQLRFGHYVVEKFYSKRIKRKSGTAKQFIENQIAGPILRWYLKIINSNHILEETVFYLAKRVANKKDSF
jgi:2-polyprenyl-3-methyl-5-hydroxy-6-metoxy-1,4-benzoquinol methylase